MLPRDLNHVADILAAARLVQMFVEGANRDIFETDLMRQSAVIRQLEVIGEAAKRLSEALCPRNWLSFSTICDRASSLEIRILKD